MRIGFSYSAGGNLSRLLQQCWYDDPTRLVSLFPSFNLTSGVSDFDVLLAPERMAVPGVSMTELWKDELWAAVSSGHEVNGPESLLFEELSLGQIAIDHVGLHRTRKRPKPLLLLVIPAFIGLVWNSSWCRHPDSNWGPTAYKAVALPTELCRHGLGRLSRTGLAGAEKRGRRFYRSMS